MSDIFLSYESRDLDRIKVLAVALESNGWSVFFDRTIPPGKTWRQVIGEEIDKCHCMIVAWSTYSINSNWVEVEADIGLKRNILVPILLDQVTPPLGFGSIQAANLVAWKGDTNTLAYKALCNALSERLDSATATVSDTSAVNHQSIIVPQKPKINWPKQHILKAAKIGAITTILAILLWFMATVILNHMKITGTSLTESIDLPNDILPLTKELTTKATNFDSQDIDQPLIKEPEMQKIPAGSFEMGSKTGSNDERPVHTVKLNSFSIGRYEVTFEEYDQFAASMQGYELPNDKGWGRGKRPVINVNWKQATEYAVWLSEKTGKHYRLATEAEWEYAARAGTVSDSYWGDTKEDPNIFAWYYKNSDNKTHPVGKKKPNTFGLYDMSGNVWEWVQDCYKENYGSAPKNGMAWESENCTFRVLRGGSWYSNRGYLRSATRDWNYPDFRNSLIGFRLAQD